MKKSIKLTIAVVIILTIVGWVLIDYFSSDTVIDAIERYAVEDYEQVYKIADTRLINDKTVCIFESRDDGFGISVLENEGNEDIKKYSQVSFQHIPFEDIKEDITKNYVLYKNKEFKILCGVIVGNYDYIYVNGNKVRLTNYKCKSIGKTVSCWTYSLSANKKEKISLSSELIN